jgi:hypothetical protein
MPVLKNPKHEHFAQALAKGMTQEAAYIAAGYRPNKSAASRLAENVNLCERVAELQQAVAERSIWDAARIVDNLARYAEKGEQLNEAAGLSVARASMMDVAKLLGLVVDKKENAGPNGGPMELITKIELVAVAPDGDGSS